MIDIPARLDALADALREVPDLQVVTDLLAVPIRPPVAVVTPPTLTFEAYSPDVTGVTAVVAIVVPVSPRALANLLTWVPLVSEAVHAAADAYVVRAEPNSFSTPGLGASPLPAYFLEVAL